VQAQGGPLTGSPPQNFLELYTLGRELGHGQFGTVYECTAKQGDRTPRAVKVINKAKMKCAEDLEDVRREVAILHLLAGHANLVCVHDAYEDAKAVYLVMEMCTGGELFDRIVELGHYSEKKAAELFRVMLDVVNHCHTLGVVHRDLKVRMAGVLASHALSLSPHMRASLEQPENFLLSAKGDAGVLKATDFGLSTFYKDGDVLHDMVGSPYYVAPEVLRRKYGRECDLWSAGVILYILLGGLPPFWGNSEKEIFDSILRGKVDFSEEPWPSISASAKDLIKGLLNQNVSQRLTVAQALAHPWMKGNAPDVKIDSAVLKRMRTFANQGKFKQLGMVMLVRHLKKEELTGLRELFLEMDEDKSGTITIDELRTGLDKHGAHLAKSEVEALMNSLDLDGTHELTYTEFMAATLQVQKLECEANLVAAFADFDTDGSGSITAEELTAKLLELGIKNSKGEIAEIIAEVDVNHDGTIDYQEFVQLMCPRLLGHCANESAAEKRAMKMKGTLR
jgi:calcium-dependent protein kinase